jgi:hypothetical protein
VSTSIAFCRWRTLTSVTLGRKGTSPRAGMVHIRSTPKPNISYSAISVVMGRSTSTPSGLISCLAIRQKRMHSRRFAHATATELPFDFGGKPVVVHERKPGVIRCSMGNRHRRAAFRRAHIATRRSLRQGKRRGRVATPDQRLDWLCRVCLRMKRAT